MEYQSEHGDNDELEQLLAELESEKEWVKESAKLDPLESLLREARATLDKDAKGPVDDMELKTLGSRTDDKQQQPAIMSSTSDQDVQPDLALTEDEEAAAYLQQILEQVELEKRQDDTSRGGTPVSVSEIKSVNTSNATNVASCASSDMPSAPTTIPTSDQNDSTSALPWLDLPDVPSTPPTRFSASNATKTQDQQFTDTEIDSWCIICTDNATVRCFGCQGDLYCAKCWREGHVGPDAGLEEKQHQWSKYRRPK